MIKKYKIVSIEKIKLIDKYMYDLETKKNHNFFANGILVHNSATAYRDDGNEMAIQTVVGDKCVNLSSKVLIEKGYLVKPIIQFISNVGGDLREKERIVKEKIKIRENELRKRLINETIDVSEYSFFYDEFITNYTERNDVVKKIVDDNKDKKILILVKLIEHGEKLQTMIPGSKYLHGSTKKTEREEMFNNFKNGNTNVLIATISIFAEGVDIPSLNMVVNASANKGNVKTIQVLGRVLRLLEGKENAFYIDFLDEIGFFKVASLARMKILRQEGHNVEIINH